MKYGIPLREFRKITKPHDNNIHVLTLLMYVYRPIECFLTLEDKRSSAGGARVNNRSNSGGGVREAITNMISTAGEGGREVGNRRINSAREARETLTTRTTVLQEAMMLLTTGAAVLE